MPSDSIDQWSRRDAIAALRAALQRDPHDRKVHLQLADQLYAVGEVDAAIGHRAESERLRTPKGDEKRQRAPPKPNHITAPIYAELKRIADGGKPIFVGPWAGEVGFELLYWLPFLWRFVEDHAIDPARLRVVSRGGVASWYDGLVPAERYVELYDIFTPGEISEISHRRHRATGSDKPMAITPWDYDLATRAFGPGDFEMLHPSLLYRLLAGYSRGNDPFSIYAGNTTFRRLMSPTSSILNDLPERYTAVKFYSRVSFPMTPENAAFVRAATLRLAEKGPVVALDTGVAAYYHEDYSPPSHPNIISLKAAMAPRDNLHLQSCVVARAEAVACTYGGFAYLPLYYGKPVTSLFSCEGHTLIKHAQAVYLLSQQIGAPISILSVEAAQQLL
jgi:hypothetical protein